MKKSDSDILIQQIRNIVRNKPLTEEMKLNSEETVDLQEAMDYLSTCLLECNIFLNHLRLGDLEAKPPGRHNFFAGSLKELHAALRHLTWQANQVASGDYNHKVSFLGDFSTSFNQMIHQLDEREAQLKNQSDMLSQMLVFMESVMDGLNDWIIVTSKETGEIVYMNQSAKKNFYDTDEQVLRSQRYTKLFDAIQNFCNQNAQEAILECAYDCAGEGKQIFQVHSYTVQWNKQPAYAHYIVDTTEENVQKEQMEEMAYTDPLTGLYNRRFCLENMKRMIAENCDFAFCMIDLDGLKYANDNFGHSAGDMYLLQVADNIVKMTRSADFVCRLGGDEIAILFYDCKESVVVQKMEQLNHKLQEQSTTFPMSVSYGVCHVEAGMETTLEDVMQQADERMYALKKHKKASR